LFYILYTKTYNNQNNLVIEKYTSNVRFCMICNYVNKIIPALQSRCTRFFFFFVFIVYFLYITFIIDVALFLWFFCLFYCFKCASARAIKNKNNNLFYLFLKNSFLFRVKTFCKIKKFKSYVKKFLKNFIHLIFF
jgi:hypothetical protein